MKRMVVRKIASPDFTSTARVVDWEYANKGKVVPEGTLITAGPRKHLILSNIDQNKEGTIMVPVPGSSITKDSTGIMGSLASLNLKNSSNFQLSNINIESELSIMKAINQFIQHNLNSQMPTLINGIPCFYPFKSHEINGKLTSIGDLLDQLTSFMGPKTPIQTSGFQKSYTFALIYKKAVQPVSA
jgi:hypothetical protein